MLGSKAIGAAILVAFGWGVLAGAQALPASAYGVQSSGSSSSSLPDPPSPTVVRPMRPGTVAPASLPEAPQIRPFSKLAVGIRVSTLGIGGQIATPLTSELNLRGAVDFFNFGYAVGIDGANYEGEVHLKGGQISLDWFPFHNAFRISPGFLFFKSAFGASVYVPGGNSFDLGNNTFTSSATDPVQGSANLVFSQSVMPALTIGTGNMIARPGKHWSIPFEVGAAYTGHYTMKINLRGTTCSGMNCTSTSSGDIQQNITDEENDIAETMKKYQIYPIVTTGVAFRF